MDNHKAHASCRFPGGCSRSLERTSGDVSPLPGPADDRHGFSRSPPDPPRGHREGELRRHTSHPTAAGRRLGKTQGGDIARDHLGSPAQVAAVVPVARRSERTEKLMRMCLENHGSGTNHFPALAPSVARRADLIKPAMGRGQAVRLRQCSLTSRLPGPIDIDHQPLPTCSVKQA